MSGAFRKTSLLLLNKEAPFWRPAAPLSGENGAVLITTTAGVKTDTASFKQWRRLAQWPPFYGRSLVLCGLYVAVEDAGCRTDITHIHLLWSQRWAALLTVQKCCMFKPVVNWCVSTGTALSVFPNSKNLISDPFTLNYWPGALNGVHFSDFCFSSVIFTAC